LKERPFLFYLDGGYAAVSAQSMAYICHKSSAASRPCERADARDVVDNLHRSMYAGCQATCNVAVGLYKDIYEC
jgi:hypothetical protein